MDINNLALKAEKIWGSSYNEIWPIIKRKKYKIGAEIGVAFGGHSNKILEKTNTSLICVDPYKHTIGYSDPMNLTQTDFDILYKYARKRLAKFGNRVKIVRKSSRITAKLIKNQIDFVYLDADHSYEGVKLDLQCWYSKIRVGGLISGHDYNHKQFPGVKRAVDEFFNRFNMNVESHPSGVWWVEKTKISISYIIPAYNCSTTISDALSSIYNGNYCIGDEVIVVDDASTDNTLEILNTLKCKYKSLKVINHKYNMGGGSARNTAVINAKNCLIFCLDSDNILASSSVKKLYEEIFKDSCDVVSFENIKYFIKKPSNIDHTWKFTNQIYSKINYLSTYVVPGASGNYLYTKNSWIFSGRYPESSSALDAWGFGLRQVMSGYMIKVVPNTHYFHRIGIESYWTRESRTRNFNLLATQLILPFIKYIDEKDVKRILSNPLTNSWFINLKETPIKVNNTINIVKRPNSLFTKILRKYI